MMPAGPALGGPAPERLSWLAAWGPHLLSSGTGITYGVLARLVFAGGRGAVRPAYADELFGVMTLSFLFGVPLVIGLVYSLRFPLGFDLRWWRALLGAMATSLLAVLATLALAIEGAICVAMATPIFVVLAGVGGLLGFGVRQVFIRSAATRAVALSVVAFSPMLSAPFEHLRPPPLESHVVANEIRIHAPASAVWRQIRSVPRIQREELPFSVSHLIGLPRPLEATLSDQRVGGVRIATFERGLSFREQVTDWQPERSLAFSIRTESAPATALDEHVTVGGPYFDVLEGTYTIETVSEHDVVLHLSSRHRLSTRFNAYAGLWTDFVMHDLQQAILTVVRQRAEGDPAP